MPNSQRRVPTLTSFNAREYASAGMILYFVKQLFGETDFPSIIQEGGINGLTSELSSTRAIYQCWYGLELEPPESEIRYCVQGKWTGENPQCGKHTIDTLPPYNNPK